MSLKVASLLSVLAATLVLANAAPATGPHRASAAERASIFAAAPFLGLALECVPLHVSVEGSFAGVWVTYKQSLAAGKCGVTLFGLENEVLLERQGSGWSPVPGSPPHCSAHVPAALLIVGTCDPSAGAAPVGGFELPSHNIVCTATPNDQIESGRPTVSCDLDSGISGSRWIADECLSPADWKVSLDSELRAREGCESTTGPIPATSRVLAYGKTATFGGVTCTSQTTGLTCVNTNGSGFMLSRAAQQIFEHPTATWKPARQGPEISFSVRLGQAPVASCQIFTGDQPAIRCDGPVKKPRPAVTHRDCDIAGLYLPATAEGIVDCVSDALILPGGIAPLLPTGKSVVAGPFSCAATASAFTCTSKAGHSIWFGPGARWRVS